MENVLTAASNALRGRKLVSRSIILSGSAFYNTIRELDNAIKISGYAYKARLSKPIWDFTEWELDRKFESLSFAELSPYVREKFHGGNIVGSHLIFSDSETNFHDLKVVNLRFVENKRFCPHKIELSYATKPI